MVILEIDLPYLVNLGSTRQPSCFGLLFLKLRDTPFDMAS